MKRLTLGLSMLICVACSADDVQVSLEKNKEEQEVQSSEVRVAESSALKVEAEASADINKPKPEMPIASNSAESQAANSGEESYGSPTDLKSSKELAGVVSISQSHSGGLTIESEAANKFKSRPSGFQSGGSSLSAGKHKLVSKAVSLTKAATSIQSDSDGFGFSIDLSGDYLFEYDKDSLTTKAQHALENVLALYRQYDGTKISITGHTDSKGSDDYNLDLSKRRANAVKQWFIEHNISGTVLSTQGYGETKPIAENTRNGQDYPQGRALNRRVTVSCKTQKKVNHLPIVPKSSAI